MMDIWLSMLEHYAYCPRQCALIHLEQTYEENQYTIKGNLYHEKVHESKSAFERGMKVERSLPLWSEKLGIRGISDVVEFPGGIPYPVEYKSGKRMKTLFKTAAHVQLCGQALCLEEMMGTEVKKGALFFKKSQRRQEIEFINELRGLTNQTITNVKTMLRNQTMPEAVNDKRCPKCSLIDSCMPELAGNAARSKQLYFIEGDT